MGSRFSSLAVAATLAQIGGRAAMSVGLIPRDDDHSLRLFSDGGKSRIRSLRIDELSPGWE